jgi:hypothetical protein
MKNYCALKSSFVPYDMRGREVRQFGIYILWAAYSDLTGKAFNLVVLRIGLVRNTVDV